MNEMQVKLGRTTPKVVEQERLTYAHNMVDACLVSGLRVLRRAISTQRVDLLCVTALIEGVLEWDEEIQRGLGYASIAASRRALEGKKEIGKVLGYELWTLDNPNGKLLWTDISSD